MTISVAETVRELEKTFAKSNNFADRVEAQLAQAAIETLENGDLRAAAIELDWFVSEVGSLSSRTRSLRGASLRETLGASLGGTAEDDDASAMVEELRDIRQRLLASFDVLSNASVQLAIWPAVLTRLFDQLPPLASAVVGVVSANSEKRDWSLMVRLARQFVATFLELGGDASASTAPLRLDDEPASGFISESLARYTKLVAPAAPATAAVIEQSGVRRNPRPGEFDEIQRDPVLIVVRLAAFAVLPYYMLPIFGALNHIEGVYDNETLSVVEGSINLLDGRLTSVWRTFNRRTPSEPDSSYMRLYGIGVPLHARLRDAVAAKVAERATYSAISALITSLIDVHSNAAAFVAKAEEMQAFGPNGDDRQTMSRASPSTVVASAGQWRGQYHHEHVMSKAKPGWSGGKTTVQSKAAYVFTDDDLANASAPNLVPKRPRSPEPDNNPRPAKKDVDTKGTRKKNPGRRRDKTLSQTGCGLHAERYQQESPSEDSSSSSSSSSASSEEESE